MVGVEQHNPEEAAVRTRHLIEEMKRLREEYAPRFAVIRARQAKLLKAVSERIDREHAERIRRIISGDQK
jgi:hypothetical protein